MWHAVAESLAEDFTIVAADLPGYGRSAPTATGSKREMAAVLVEVMADLGFERFFLAGHDRGGRCAYRLALDSPDRVDRLAVLDIVPTAEMWRRVDKEFGLIDWHWFFLAQPEPFPEELISVAPETYYFRGDRSRFHPEALADYLASVRDPAVVRAMCRDYRAGATVDQTSTRRTWQPAEGSTARCLPCGPGATSWAAGSTSSRPGGAGRMTFADSRSMQATSFPRSDRRR
jgi:haloacetate dehalogenase